MNNLEIRLKEKGAMLIQPQAVNDGGYNYFYRKPGYNNASNPVY